MKPGTVVNVRWDQDCWYVGTVQSVKKKTERVVVHYIDGDTVEHNFTKEEYHILAPPDDPLCLTNLCEVAPKSLTCPICLEVFRFPRTIKSCMHTFCGQCISEISNCALCGVPFEAGDAVCNPIISTLSNALRPEIDAAFGLLLVNQGSVHPQPVHEKVNGVEKTIEKKTQSSCRKCGKKKPRKQLRCGIACA
jgi:hypothetical protein